MTKAGEGILAGARDALAYVQGDKSRGRAHIIINSKVDVKAIRAEIGMTQKQFAETYGFSLSNIKKWETNASKPQGSAKAYLTVIAQKPKVVKEALWSAV